jgi:hypothetical protein
MLLLYLFRPLFNFCCVNQLSDFFECFFGNDFNVNVYLNVILTLQCDPRAPLQELQRACLSLAAA